jgi:hypothetical protein
MAGSSQGPAIGLSGLRARSAQTDGRSASGT